MIQLKNNEYSYSMGDFLGKGAFGLVVKCKRNLDGQYFALKIIEKYRLNPREYLLEALKREIDTQKSATASNLPFFVGLYDSFEDDKNVYMVLELCEKSLLETIQGIMPEAKALGLVFQLALGLGYLHEKGISHRDLKLENFLIKGKYLKIADFGFAISSSHFTTSLGTKTYMSPEFFNNACEEYTPKVDVWALNTCLYKLITGKFYFFSPIEAEMRRLILKKEFTADPVKDKISPLTEDLLKKGFEKDPEKRISMRNYCLHPAFEPFRTEYADSMRVVFPELQNTLPPPHNLNPMAPPYNISSLQPTNLLSSINSVNGGSWLNKEEPGSKTAKMLLRYRNNCLIYSRLANFLYQRGFNKLIAFCLVKLHVQKLMLVVCLMKEEKVPNWGSRHTIDIPKAEWVAFQATPLFGKLGALAVMDIKGILTVHFDYYKSLIMIQRNGSESVVVPDVDLNVDNRAEVLHFLENFVGRVHEVDYVNVFQEEAELAVKWAKRIIDFEIKNPDSIFD